MENFSASDRALVLDSIRALMYNDGVVYDEQGNSHEIVLADMVRKEDLLPLMSEAVTRVLIEEIEPEAVIYEHFFHEIQSNGVSHHLQLHNFGPLTVQPLGEYGDYPETPFALDQDGISINLVIQRYGIELRLHEEVVQQNQLPVVAMWLRRAKNAFVRNREKLAIQELKKTGVVVFDNDNPSKYAHDVKSYTGRGISGAANGSMSLNDLMEIYVGALMEGYTIDTIAMNPFAWQTFMTDPEMKEIVVNNNTIVSYRAPNGTAAKGRFTALEGPNKLGLPWSKGYGNPELDPTLAKLGINPYSRGLSTLGATFHIPPNYFPTPLTVVVSPFVPLSKIGNTYVTDIIFAQSGEAGLVLREGEPIVKQFKLEEKEALVIRMREGLGYGMLNLGRAVRIAKNVVIARNYVFQNMNAVSLGVIDRKASHGPF